MNEKLKDLKDLNTAEFFTARDLVILGLFPSVNATYLARRNGKSPDFIRVGGKILYPKRFIEAFIEKHAKKGDILKEKNV